MHSAQLGCRGGQHVKRLHVLLQKHPTIYETLKRIGDAEQRKLDTWRISLTSGDRTHSPTCFTFCCISISLSRKSALQCC